MNWYQLTAYIKFKLFGKKHSSSKGDKLSIALEELDSKEMVYYCFDEIEDQRQKLLNDSSIIHVTDYGAGSKVLKSNERKISDIAKYSLKPPEEAQLIFKLANHFGAKNILELGTSLGVTTTYLAKVNSEAKVFTIEGCPEIAKVASAIFEYLNIQNISLSIGNIDEKLPELLSKTNNIDFVLIDGNHTKEATINYFNQIVEKTNKNGIVIVDDIYWSRGMTEAWSEIRNHQKVSAWIDLFDLGILMVK